MKERAGCYSARLLFIVTKKRRAEAEAAYNDVSDAAQYLFFIKLLVIAHIDTILHSLRIQRSHVDNC